MESEVKRTTVDLSGYPDLIVIYLGMRVNRLTGLKTLLGFGPKIADSASAQPDGLLLHETVIYSLFPMNVGMRQYWRDMGTLLAGHALSLTKPAGGISFATLAELVFGMKPI